MKTRTTKTQLSVVPMLERFESLESQGSRGSPETYDNTPSTPVTDFVPASPKPARPPASSFARKWFALRWHLSRTVFSRPIPFLTETLELKKGDVLVTLPFTALVIAANSYYMSIADVHYTAWLPTLAMAAVFALAVRNNSIVLATTGISFERALFYHKYFAGVTWILTATHALALLLEDDATRTHHYDDVVVYAGFIMFFALTGIIAFSLPPVRRRYFDLFLQLHWILFVAIVVAGIMHGAGLLLIGFVPFVIDLLYRYRSYLRNNSRSYGAISASHVTVKLVAKDLVRVQFPRVHPGGEAGSADRRPFEYEAGQYVFLCFPAVALMEWHPFSIASAPHEPTVTIYVKVLGDWTKKLADMAAKTDSPTTPSMLVDGPYGAVSIDMDYYAHYVFVSGGIGATPMISLANSLYYDAVASRTREQVVEKAWFVWSVRDRETIKALMDTTGANCNASAHTWLPNALMAPSSGNSRESDAFYARFSVTKDEQDLSEPIDQQLVHCLTYGARPDVAKTLIDMGTLAIAGYDSTAKKPVRVGVLVCGPAAMVSDVLRQSMRVSKQLDYAAVFDVHQETFDF